MFAGGRDRGQTTDRTFDRIRDVPVDPEKTAGAASVQVQGGYIVSPERDWRLIGRRRYEHYSEMIANCEIIATGVYYNLALVSKVPWEAEPIDESAAAKEAADLVNRAIENLASPWDQIVRRLEMSKFYGFGVAEWTAKRLDDGSTGLLDIESRPPSTIERWDVDDFGVVQGFVQRSPMTLRQYYIPRAKTIYLVDDAVSETPEGFGILRSCVKLHSELEYFERLEGLGFENDLRGIPIGRAPISTLNKLVQSGEMTAPEAEGYVQSIRDFITNHPKRAGLGLLLDSATYAPPTPPEVPSSIFKWGVDLIQGGTSSHDAIRHAINDKTFALARRCGVEHLVLGSTSRGSAALSRDKSDNVATQVDSDVKRIAHAVKADLYRMLCLLNGIPAELCPKPKNGRLQWRDIEQVTSAVKDMFISGAPFPPDDPIWGSLRESLGVPAQPAEMTKRLAMQAALPRPPMPGAPGGGQPPGSQPGAAGGRTLPPNPKSGAAAGAAPTG